MSKIGIIAEDQSDIDVVKCLARKISGKSISCAYFTGKGCGSIRRKAEGWCNDLQRKGCDKLLVVHDRDANNKNALKVELEKAFRSCPQSVKVIIIPCEELEAWLLSDMGAIKNIFKLKKNLKSISRPENVSSPKEHIENLVWVNSDKTKRYVNSVHNKLIATEVEIDLILSKCSSFKDFFDFFN